jgi:hypothetical protein
VSHELKTGWLPSTSGLPLSEAQVKALRERLMQRNPRPWDNATPEVKALLEEGGALDGCAVCQAVHPEPDRPGQPSTTTENLYDNVSMPDMLQASSLSWKALLQGDQGEV